MLRSIDRGIVVVVIRVINLIGPGCRGLGRETIRMPSDGNNCSCCCKPKKTTMCQSRSPYDGMINYFCDECYEKHKETFKPVETHCSRCSKLDVLTDYWVNENYLIHLCMLCKWKYENNIL